MVVVWPALVLWPPPRAADYICWSLFPEKIDISLFFFYGSKKNPSSALAKRSGGNDKRRRISSTVFTESECVLFSSWLITRILLRWKWQLSWEHFRSHELNSNLLPPFDVSYTWWRKKETTTVSRLWIMDHYGSTSNINTAVAPRRRDHDGFWKQSSSWWWNLPFWRLIYHEGQTGCSLHFLKSTKEWQIWDNLSSKLNLVVSYWVVRTKVSALICALYQC